VPKTRFDRGRKIAWKSLFSKNMPIRIEKIPVLHSKKNQTPRRNTPYAAFLRRPFSARVYRGFGGQVNFRDEMSFLPTWALLARPSGRRPVRPLTIMQ
jgi:hypothetical protein